MNQENILFPPYVQVRNLTARRQHFTPRDFVPPYSVQLVPIEIARALIGDPNWSVDTNAMGTGRFVEDDTIHLGWQSPLDVLDGYGGVANDILKGLCDLGYCISAYSSSYLRSAGLHPEVIAALLGDKLPCTYGVNMTWPPGVARSRWPNTFGFTMFETSRINPLWALRMNECKEIWVPASFLVEEFREGGVTVPIRVIPLGTDPVLYEYIDREDDGLFTFLITGTLTGRKNPMAAVAAFMMAFPGKTDVRLLLKSRRNAIGPSEANLIWRVAKDDRIDLVLEDYGAEQMAALMHRADCFVFPSKGEGFGMPPVHAMATGLPVIIPQNTGMLEYTDERYNYPISAGIKCKAEHFPPEWGDVGDWYEPDIEELAAKMLYVYEHQGEARAKGRAAAQWVRGRFTYHHTAQAISKIVGEYAGQEPSGLQKLCVPVTETQEVTPNMKVVFVLIAHNGLEHTIRCLHSISRYCPFDYEIVFIDGASTDATWDVIQKHPNVLYRERLPENYGVAANRNAALRWLINSDLPDGTIINILDNDVELTSEESYVRFVRWFSDFDHHTIAGAYGYFWPTEVGGRLQWTPNGYADPEGTLVDVVSGCCQLMRLGTIRKVGFYDESLEWHEDSEYCLRARALLSATVLHFGYTGIWHHGMGTTLVVRRERFAEKHDGDLDTVLRRYEKLRCVDSHG